MSDNVTAEATTSARPQKVEKVGRVVSDKMDKTVVVSVDSVRRHPLYHKRITRSEETRPPIAISDPEGFSDNAPVVAFA